MLIEKNTFIRAHFVRREGDMVVGNQPGTEQVVIRQPQSNGHQRSFTYEDCSYIDEGNETFEEKKWNENGGASITINDVSGIRVEQKQ